MKNRLDFDTHVTNICNRVSKKLHALARMKAFLSSEFRYYPLVWMFHSGKLNCRVYKLHERTLRIVCQDYASSFTELLEEDNSTTIHNRNIHNRNIQLLATELFKVKTDVTTFHERSLYGKCTALL